MNEGDASTLGSRSYEDNDNFHAQDNGDTEDVPTILTAATELSNLVHDEFGHIAGSDANPHPASSSGFPSKLLPIVLLFPGNHCCVDCGNEDEEELQYGSVGYGTVLCEECANRHMVYTGEESCIQPLAAPTPWNLRSILSLLSGSNSQMLEYIRTKPRWRPTKSDTSDPDEVLVFKQIYLSKAASTYRDLISQSVESTYKEKLVQVQSELNAQEQLYQMNNNVLPLDPFDAIFARNNVSREDIPGFARKVGRTSNINGLGDSFSTVQGGNQRRNNNPSSSNTNRMAVPSFMPEALPMDAIKAKIHARRNRNPSIRARAQQYDDGMAHDMMRGMNLNDEGEMMMDQQYHPQQQQEDYSQYNDYSSYRRRSIDIVGEVNEFSVQDQEYDDVDQYQWNSERGYDYNDTISSMAGYGTNTLPRYRNDDVKSVGVSVAASTRGRGYDGVSVAASARGRGFDEQTLGSIPYEASGVRLATYRRTSLNGK